MKRFLPKSINNPKGFTLVELLVVISIIAILSVIGVTVFTGVQKSARDSRRKLDIEAASKAFEVQYSQTTGYYPNSLLPTYFSSGVIPVDPQNTGTQVYTWTYVGVAGAMTGYVFCAKMENGNGGNSSSAAGVPAVNGGFYCMKNSQ